MDSLTIALSQGRYATVDAVAYEHLSQLSWHAHVSPSGHVYARRTQGTRSVYMHRLVLQLARITIPLGRKAVVHRNGDTLDNRLSNLAIVPRGQHERKTTRGYKGVYQVQNRTLKRPWKASVTVNGKAIHLGYFGTEAEAAIAYNEAAIRYFGVHATLNRLDRIR